MSSDLGHPTSDLGPRASGLGPPASCPLIFKLREEVAVEDFEARSLALLCDALQLRELNARSRQLIAHLDGRRTIQDIVGVMAAESGETDADLQAMVTEALLELERQGIVRRVVDLKTERPKHMSEAIYLRDPDISFRQEDEDGGILYNEATDSLEILNPTAVEIWTFLSAPHTQADVVAHLCEVCADAPRDQATADVAEFIEAQLAKGFIGVVEPPV